jgi:hypothetical protein
MKARIMMNSETHRRLGNWLKCKRKDARLSCAQVAKLIGQNEVFVTRYEAGGRLGLLEFEKIIDVLGAEPEEVIGAQGILAGNPTPPVIIDEPTPPLELDRRVCRSPD